MERVEENDKRKDCFVRGSSKMSRENEPAFQRVSWINTYVMRCHGVGALVDAPNCIQSCFIPEQGLGEGLCSP